MTKNNKETPGSFVCASACARLMLLLFLGGCGGTATEVNNGAGGSGGNGGSSMSSGGSGGSADELPFDSSDLQLNDVSVLFPVSSRFNEHAGGLLDMTASGARGQLLPSALYTTVGPISGAGAGGPAGVALYANLRVVGARIDPCFASLAPPHDGVGCQNELRLIVQEVVGGVVHDSAIHLFYGISRDEVIALVRATASLRQALMPNQRLGRLQPHPIMVAQAPNGSMATGVNAAILAHAGASNLIRITTMSSDGGGNPTWKFAGFDIKAGVPTAIKIFGLSAGATEQDIQTSPGLRSVRPPSSSPDAFAPLLDLLTIQTLTKAQQTSLFTSLRRVEDPGVYSPETIDCVTCHLTTPTMKIAVEQALGVAADTIAPSFMVDTSVVPANEMEATYTSDVSLNVHAFSYVANFSGQNSAGISQRTVNETAAVVTYLVHDVFPAKR